MDEISSLEFFSPKTHLLDISTKLASSNYLLKAQVLLILRGHGLLGYLINELPCPPTAILDNNNKLFPNPEATKWLRLDQLILLDAPSHKSLIVRRRMMHGKFFKFCRVNIQEIVFNRCMESFKLSQKALHL